MTMTTAEAAAELGISEGLVRRFCREEKLKAVRHGRDWWITKAEVARFKALPRPKTGRKPRRSQNEHGVEKGSEG